MARHRPGGAKRRVLGADDDHGVGHGRVGQCLTDRLATEHPTGVGQHHGAKRSGLDIAPLRQMRVELGGDGRFVTGIKLTGPARGGECACRPHCRRNGVRTWLNLPDSDPRPRRGAASGNHSKSFGLADDSRAGDGRLQNIGRLRGNANRLTPSAPMSGAGRVEHAGHFRTAVAALVAVEFVSADVVPLRSITISPHSGQYVLSRSGS